MEKQNKTIWKKVGAAVHWQEVKHNQRSTSYCTPRGIIEQIKGELARVSLVRTGRLVTVRLDQLKEGHPQAEPLKKSLFGGARSTGRKPDKVKCGKEIFYYGR